MRSRHNPGRWAALLAAGLAAVTLGACPRVPHTTFYTADAAILDPDAEAADDADVVIPVEVYSLHENVGDPEGGERVSVFGAGFEVGAKVWFGDELAGGILVIEPGQLNCDAPAHDPGLVDVTVELLDGRSATLTEAYLYRAPLQLWTVDPAEGLLLGGEAITVVGEGFDEDTAILIGGRLLEDQELVDETTITGVAPSRLASRVGPVDVIASTGFEQRSLVRGYRYVDTLRVDWLSPAASGIEGGTLVTLYGTGFEPGTGVTVDGTVAEIVQPGAGSVLTLRVPPHLEGPVSLVVDNGYEVRSLALAFAYVDHEALEDAPVLLNAWPGSGGTAGGSQVVLTVTGLLADSEVAVTFGGAEATVLEVRPDEDGVIVAIPEGEAGATAITLVVDGVTVTRDDLFSYQDTLSVAQLIPASAKPAGGKVIVIEGTGFTPATVVRFGGRVAAFVGVPTAEEIVVELPAGSPGLVDVRVGDDQRSVMAAAGFEYRTGEAAKLLGVAPPDGARSGGRLVRLYGTGFTNFTPAADFGAEPGVDAEVIDDATLHVRAPRGDVGNVTVDAGPAGRLAMTYRYFDPTAKYGGTGGDTIPEALNVTVLDLQTRAPIPEAFVILWDDLETPYQALTDDRGQLTFSDPGFGPPQMVTAGKDQYTTASVVDFDARNVTLFLLPLVSAPPAPGGPGPGPQPLPDGAVAGSVLGFEKYIIPPLGSCDPKLEAGDIAHESSLCQVCEEDADCPEEGALCTFLGEQGARCTTPCEMTSDCPSGFVCSGVAGGYIQCVPAPGIPTAWCGTTIPDLFADEDQRPGGYTNGNDFFELTSAPGEHAVVCLGGYMNPDVPGDFVPMRMGVRRHVFTLPGDFVAAQDVVLDIPLTRTLRLRLDDPPLGANQPDHFAAEVFLDLGSDGVFPMPTTLSCVDRPAADIDPLTYPQGEAPLPCSEVSDGGLEFSLPSFPEKFEDSLYDASYAIYAQSKTQLAWLGQANTASYTLHQDLTQLDDDTVVELVDGGVVPTSTGVALDVEAMHGPPGDERVWAVSSTGEIVMWNGAWWGVQAWFDTPLRAVWSRAGDDAWAAGDAGLVAHWDGLVWTPLSVPDEVAGARWWGMDGHEDTLWLVGDAGVWRLDPDGWYPVSVGTGVTASSIRAVWAAGPDDVWFVGIGGLIRRVTADGLSILDQPGEELLDVHGLDPSDVWAVGRAGRLLHWDGMFWFDYLPRSGRRDLRAVHGVATDEVWAVGDAGVVVRWDGKLWTPHQTVEHMDLSAIWVSGDGRARAGGAHILIIGPFLRIPRSVNPTSTYDHVSLRLEWQVDGPGADFTYLQLTEGGGFPFWQLLVDGWRTDAPLPDLKAAWGLDAIWPGQGFMRMIRVIMPEFSIDAWDNTDLSQYVWRSWATEDYPVLWSQSPAPF